MAIFWIVVIRKGINTGAVAGAFALLSAYISWRALAGDAKYALIRTTAVAFAAIGGTSFRHANLTDAVFAPGDFEQLYTKIMNTVQILLRNGINPEAFRTAFQQLMEEHPDITPDSIQGVEKKGKDVLVTLEVSEDTDKGAVEHQFLEVYQAKLEAQKQAALRDVEARRSQDIKEIAIAALTNHPSSFNLTNNVTAENKAMNNSIDRSQNINVGGDVTGSTLNIGEISGTVSNAINQLPPSPTPEQPGIKELLAQLQAAIEAEPNLDNEDKAEALEQVKALAEAGQNPQEGSKQKLAKRATTMLKGIVSGLPDAAKLVGEVSKLLPAIAKIFGLG